MSVKDLLRALESRGIRLRVDGDALTFRGPRGALTPELRQAMIASKRQLVEFLRASEAGARPPIQRAAIDDDALAPPSAGQARLWFLDRLAPGSPLYNVHFGLRVRGAMDVRALQASLGAVAERHAMLRAVFVEVDGAPRVAVQPPRPWDLPTIDLRAVASGQRKAELKRLCTEHATAPFDLSRGPLARTTLVTIDDEEHVLLVTQHHAITDAMSIGILLRDLLAIYESETTAAPRALADLPVRYVDYATWQEAEFHGEAVWRSEEWWKQKLRDLPRLELPTSYSPLAEPTHAGGAHSFVLSPELTAGLKGLARSQGCTLFVALLAVWSALLHRYSGQDDFAIGTVTSGRDQDELRDVVGFFVNTLVLRCDLTGDPDTITSMGRLRSIVEEALRHQDVPFDRVVSAVGAARGRDLNPLFRASLGLENAPLPDASVAGWTCTPLMQKADGGVKGVSKFDLGLTMMETDGELRATLEYAVDLFDAAAIERIAAQLQVLARAAVADPRRRVSELPILPDEEERRLAEWSAPRADPAGARCIHELFEAQAERTPDAIALALDGHTVTYRDLDRRANQLARHLRARGVGPEVKVGVCAERSIETIIGLLGISKAGGAYVALDPHLAADRLAFKIADMRAPVVLTLERLVATLPVDRDRLIALDADFSAVARESPRALGRIAAPENLAYVTYASGSTGGTVGVGCTHASVWKRLAWAEDAFALVSGDAVLQITPSSLGLPVWETFWPLVAGARLVLARPGGHRDGAYLARLIEEERITTLHFAPSMLAAFLVEPGFERCAGVRLVLTSGEALPFELARDLYDQSAAELCHLYAPAGTAIEASFRRYPRTDPHAAMPIGRPIASTQLHVLDASGRHAPIGAPGELHVGGAGVARGYLNRPELTAERFVPDPFATTAGSRLYKTGDVCRWLPDGTVEYLGRRDNQVGLAVHVEAAQRMPRPRTMPPHGSSPARARDPFPLSFAQRRMWFLDHLAPESTLYTIPAAVRLVGPLDEAVLERSLREIVRRHESLRTTFPSIDGEPRQRVSPDVALPFIVVEAGGVGVEGPAVDVLRLARDEARRRFDLAEGPLVRATLVRWSADERVLLVTMHHIVSDAWSLGVMVRELATLYGAFAAGRSSPLPDLDRQYADYALWQQQRLSGDALAQELAYWKQRLSGAPQALELQTDRPRPPVQSHHGSAVRVAIGRDLSDAVGHLAEREGVTLFVVLLAAFQVLLHRYTGDDDVVVGSPIAWRTRAGTEGLIGFFVNMLALRTDLSGAPSVHALLARVRDVTFGAYDHQEVPFEKLVEELAPARDVSRSPIFQVAFALQNTPRAEVSLGDVKLEVIELDHTTAKFDLTLLLDESAEGIGGALEYNTDLFDRSTASRMTVHYETLLRGFVGDPRRRIPELPWVTPAEQRRVTAEWNATDARYPDNRCIHHLVEAQVERTPGAVAVVAGGASISYRELNERANELAHRLRALGVRAETRVAVCVERSLEMVIGLLGILKAGGAYVPLDPTYPEERLAFMLDDAAAPVLVTQGHVVDRLVDRVLRHRAEIVVVNARRPLAPAARVDDPAAATTAQGLAYVVYTSGSTGRPKGVLVEHRGLVNLAEWHRRTYDLGPGSRTTQVATLGFDAATWEIWPPLVAGATLFVVDDETRASPARLARWLVEREITSAFLPTPLAEEVLGEPWPVGAALRVLLTGGDRLRRRPPAGTPFRVVNHYGPTESTVLATAITVEHAGARAPAIGRPIANARVYVLDAHLRPVPVGVAGELFVGGVGVARGYANRPDLTAERFVQDPFSGAGARMYRTGDLCRWLPDGTIEYLERVDRQVKVRGFRVELGEIESVLRSHRAIADAVVTAYDASGETRLAAYVVARDRAAPRGGELQAFLRQRLPEHMIPTSYAALAAIPLTLHGKIDRRALPAPISAPNDASGSPPAFGSVEIELLRLWEDVLGVTPIGVRQDFFALGGHSLSVVKLLKRVEDHFGHAPPLSTFFQRPTIEALAEHLRARPPARPWSPLVAISTEGAGRPFFCVHPALGSVAGYDALARGMGRDRPFYALRSIGLERDQEPDTTVEAMAERYVDALLAVQPEGPYLLGGHSFGGTVAFEMARRLVRAGARVAVVALLDTMPPALTAPRGAAAGRDEDALELVALYALLREAGIPAAYDDLRRLDPDERIERSLSLLVDTGAIPAGYPLDQMKRIVTWRAKIVPAAARAYTPRPFAEHVVLLRASEDPPFAPGVLSAVDADPALMWRELTSGPLEVIDVPGDHFSMLRPPHVGALAERLRRCLLAAD